MKVLICSDLHLHAHKGSLQRLDDCLSVLEWICRTAVDRDITEILFCGDLFQDRQKIHVLAYQRTFEVFQRYSGSVNWRLLLGNHDLWFAEKHDVSSVFPINAVPGVTVIAKPSSVEIGGRWFDWLPYVKNPLKAIEENFPDRAGRVLCAHIALDGCQLHSAGQTSDVSVEYEGDMVRVGAEHFNAWDRVFMGHYHAAQNVTPTVEYVGSPLQLNFSEAHQDKHVIVLDTEDLSVEYVKNTFSPKHLILREDQLGGVDLLNNYVWIVGDLSQFDAFEMSRKLESKRMRKLEFRAKRLREEIEEGEAAVREAYKRFNLADGKTLERYIEAVGCGNLERTLAVQVGVSLCEEEKP